MKTEHQHIAASLRKLQSGTGLSRHEAEAVMEELLAGRLAHNDIVALLTLLRAKGESVEELVGFAWAMRRRVYSGNGGAATGSSAGYAGTPANSPIVDTCGTGGDGSGTFNVSTAAAFVAAGAGARVAKHGNRSFSSRSGSADVLEALGVNIDVPPEHATEAL